MTLRADGRNHCDRCGIDVGNANVLLATKVSTTETATDGSTSAVTYDLCREAQTGAPNGCSGLVMTVDNLADYHAHREGTDVSTNGSQ